MARKIVSLLPSATEIVCALGLADRLVGVSHECDFPPEVRGLPVLTSARIPASGSSRTIDRGIRDLVRNALGVYEIDVEALGRLRPDVVLTQDLCDVCAVSFEDVLAAVQRIASPRTRLISLRPERLSEVWADLRRVAGVCGVPAAADRWVAGAERRLARISDLVKGLGRPATLSIEWLDPVMIGGLWMPDLIAAAGGRNLVTSPGEPAPTLSREQLVALDPAPEVVLIKPCGFTVQRTMSEVAALRAAFEELRWPAIAARRVFVADGNAYFNRPGPRLVESAEILAACLHPEAVPELMAAHRDAFRPVEPQLP